jgi:DNA-binding IclR family transcriptional regulator
MSTQKIEEAIRQLYREGDRPLRDAAERELVTLKRAIRDIVHRGYGYKEISTRDLDAAWELLRTIANDYGRRWS